MDEKEEITALDPEEARARQKLGRRLVSMAVFMVILAIPIGIGGYRVWRVWTGESEQQALAEQELTKAQPLPGAYGVLGTIYLDKGRIAEALPLLERAAQVEALKKKSAHDILQLARAHIVGSHDGVPGALTASAVAALEQSLKVAPGLPAGDGARTYFSVGMFYRQLGKRSEALNALEKAVALQPDDWVDLGSGVRFKQTGVSGYYQKMLAAAQMD